MSASSGLLPLRKLSRNFSCRITSISSSTSRSNFTSSSNFTSKSNVIGFMSRNFTSSSEIISLLPVATTTTTAPTTTATLAPATTHRNLSGVRDLSSSSSSTSTSSTSTSSTSGSSFSSGSPSSLEPQSTSSTSVETSHRENATMDILKAEREQKASVLVDELDRDDDIHHIRKTKQKGKAEVKPNMARMQSSNFKASTDAGKLSEDMHINIADKSITSEALREGQSQTQAQAQAQAQALDHDQAQVQAQVLDRVYDEAEMNRRRMASNPYIRLETHPVVGFKAVASTDLLPGQVINRFSEPVSLVPTMHTVCLADGYHVAPTNQAEFISHACGDTNTCIQVSPDRKSADFVTTRHVAAGEDLSFNYNITEWELSCSFVCACPICTKEVENGRPPAHIRGFKHLSIPERERLMPEVSPYILEKSINQMKEHLNNLAQSLALKTSSTKQ